MKKLSSTPLNMILSLGLITAISAILLAVSYDSTREATARSEVSAREAALAEVLPAFDNAPLDAPATITAAGDSEPVTVYAGREDGHLSGVAVESYSLNGFSGRISVLVGFSPDGTITGYKVLDHAETPGLGARMDEWFRDKQGHRNVIGIEMSIASPLSVTKDGGSVDAITAATISSRAFTDALNRAYRAFNAYLHNTTEP